MNDVLWAVLIVIVLAGAYREFLNAWFLYQCRKRRQAERRQVERRGLRLVISKRSH